MPRLSGGGSTVLFVRGIANDIRGWSKRKERDVCDQPVTKNYTRRLRHLSSRKWGRRDFVR